MNIKFRLLTFLLLILSIRLLSQTPNIMWINSYIGSSNGDDSNNDLAVDNSGNLFAVGSTFNGTNSDIIITKYNANTGDTIWTRTYNGAANGNDASSGCILDNLGNLYVVGNSYNGSNQDFILIKYNSANGDTVWTKKYDGSANGNDVANECALDGSGNIYVVGTSSNGNNIDYLTIKYNSSNGNIVWSKQFNGAANGADKAFGCSWDGNGNLYVSGYSYNGSDYNLLTIKYNANGDTLWTKRSADTLDSLRIPQTDCVTDASGNVYIIGMCGININFGNRYNLITKYNSAGDSVWVSRYDGISIYDQPLGCALDGTGNLYVTGTTYNGSTHDDLFTIKYNSSNGNILWTKKYIAASDTGSYGISCVVDNLGQLYITGTKAKVDNSGQTVSSSFDSFTLKYTSTVTSVETDKLVPSSFVLKQNYPNPFNPTTIINYSLPKQSNVKITIFDLLGREIITLVNEEKSVGNYKVEFNSSSLSSGIYLYQMKTSEFLQTKKMILLK